MFLADAISILMRPIAIAGLALLCLFLYCYYNRYLHPLSRFPGPAIAAIGPFYEFYHDVVRDGMYLWEIEKMHNRYGPIVRINARSLHINDPEHFHHIYAGGKRKTDKDAAAVAGYTFPHSTISTIDHDLHRKRRAVISPYFSKKSVVGLEPLIHERLDKLCSRLRSYADLPVHIDLTAAFSAFTADVVTAHFYGSHLDYLSSDGFEFSLKRALTALLNFYHISRFLPLPANLLKSLPAWILRFADPGFPTVIAARAEHKEQVEAALREQGTDQAARSVIVGALTDPEIPAVEKTLDRLLDEGETIILAGIDTTARTLAVAMFHLCMNPDIVVRLRQELAEPQTQWTTVELENLPLMRGVVQEALRLSYGLVVRIPRISTTENLQYGDFTIPCGTPVSQSTYLMNNNASVFPEPQKFDPDRWIRAAKEGINLDKYMVSFSKGSRACVGINLSYTMLFLGIARVVMCFDAQLVDTDHTSLQVHHTRGFAFPKHGSGAVKVRLVSKPDTVLPATPAISRAARLEQV